jgi:hypothetical protein
MMLLGSAFKSLDAFAQEFVFSQMIGLWAIKSQIHSYEEDQTLRLQRGISELIGLVGLIGLAVFASGLIIYVRWLAKRRLGSE